MLTGVSPKVALLCPIALCSTWFHVPLCQPRLACQCCWRLLLAMTCCCGEMFTWHLPSVTQHRLCCARQTQQWQDPWLCVPGAQTAELVAPIGIPEPLLCMGLLTLSQLHSSVAPSAPAPCCHCSQGLEELGGSWLGSPAREMHLLHRRGLHPSQGFKLQHVNSLSPAC